MSIDTTFKPQAGPVGLISGTPVQIVPAGSSGVLTFRVVNTSAGSVPARINWGRTAALTPTPVVGTPSPNSILLQPNSVCYIEVPGDSFFNMSAGDTVEVSGGQGGIGG